jgi:hypothetical protein
MSARIRPERPVTFSRNQRRDGPECALTFLRFDGCCSGIEPRESRREGRRRFSIECPRVVTATHGGTGVLGGVTGAHTARKSTCEISRLGAISSPPGGIYRTRGPVRWTDLQGPLDPQNARQVRMARIKRSPVFRVHIRLPDRQLVIAAGQAPWHAARHRLDAYSGPFEIPPLSL